MPMRLSDKPVGSNSVRFFSTFMRQAWQRFVSVECGLTVLQEREPRQLEPRELEPQELEPKASWTRLRRMRNPLAVRALPYSEEGLHPWARSTRAPAAA